MAKFEAEIVRPLFQNKTFVTESEWATITAKFPPYETWIAAKAGAGVEKLGIGRVREILAIILIISGPSMILAWLKLRKRNLGPILDANGWAVNAKVKINMPFGASLTRIGALPPGAHRDMTDPFAEKKRPWGWYLAILIIVLLALGWIFGKFDRVLSSLSPKITSSWVIHHQALPSPEGARPENKSPAEQKQ